MNHSQAEPLLSDMEADVMDKSVVRPVGRELTGRHLGGQPVSAATVGLMTAAHVLGISPDEAGDLARRGEFPCNVIETSEGYRVSFAVLLQVLGSGPVRDTDHDRTMSAGGSVPLGRTRPHGGQDRWSAWSVLVPGSVRVGPWSGPAGPGK